MRADQGVALKEWAAVCQALGEGRQTLLLRKGGLDEGREGFRIEHDEFWLAATRFHQDASQLAPDGEALLSRAAHWAPAPGQIALPLYAVVERVAYVRHYAQLEMLSALHVLSPAAVRQRFEYRRPGIDVAVVRVFRPAAPLTIPERAHYAGCKSWVMLDQPLPTTDLTPAAPESRLAATLATLASAGI